MARSTSQVGDRGAARLAAALEKNEVAELEMGIERWEKETVGGSKVGKCGRMWDILYIYILYTVYCILYMICIYQIMVYLSMSYCKVIDSE